MEDGLGIGGLFGTDVAEFLLRGRVAGKYLGDLAADELECDEYWLVLRSDLPNTSQVYDRRARMLVMFLNYTDHGRGTHSFKFGELGREWVEDFDKADRQCLQNLDDAWELSGKWDYLGYTSNHLIPFGGEVRLMQRVDTLGEG